MFYEGRSAEHSLLRPVCTFFIVLFESRSSCSFIRLVLLLSQYRHRILPGLSRDGPAGWKRSPPRPTNGQHAQPLPWHSIPQGVFRLRGLCWETCRPRRSVSLCTVQNSISPTSPFLVSECGNRLQTFPPNVLGNHQVSLSFRTAWRNMTYAIYSSLPIQKRIFRGFGLGVFVHYELSSWSLSSIVEEKVLKCCTWESLTWLNVPKQGPNDTIWTLLLYLVYEVILLIVITKVWEKFGVSRMWFHHIIWSFYDII